MNRRKFVARLSSIGLIGALPVGFAAPALAGLPASRSATLLNWRALADCAACTGNRYRIAGPESVGLSLDAVLPGHDADPLQFVARFRADRPLADGLYELSAGGERRLLYLQAHPNDPCVLRAEINLAG